MIFFAGGLENDQYRSVQYFWNQKHSNNSIPIESHPTDPQTLLGGRWILYWRKMGKLEVSSLTWRIHHRTRRYILRDNRRHRSP